MKMDTVAETWTITTKKKRQQAREQELDSIYFRINPEQEN